MLSFLSLFDIYWIFSGRIDAAEIQHSLRSIGVDLSLEDANRILLRSATFVSQWIP